MNSLRDTVHEQATHTIITVVHGNPVTSLVELVRSGQTSRAGTNDSDLLSSTDLGDLRGHPAHLEALQQRQRIGYK